MCPICLDDLNFKNNDVSFLPCKHKFHKNCINKWFETSKIISCPMCRDSLDENAELKHHMDHLLVKIGSCFKKIEKERPLVFYIVKLYDTFLHYNTYRNVILELCKINPKLINTLARERLNNLIYRQYYNEKENYYEYNP